MYQHSVSPRSQIRHIPLVVLDGFEMFLEITVNNPTDQDADLACQPVQHSAITCNPLLPRLMSENYRIACLPSVKQPWMLQHVRVTEATGVTVVTCCLT